MRTDILPLLVVAMPFAAFLAMLLWRKASLLSSSLVALALFSAASLLYWRVELPWFGFAYAKGALVALDIFLIIAGAIFFLGMLKGSGVIGAASYYIESFSRDYRVQVIMLAWFFEGFLEGTAGFGTPIAIVAPLLVGLGLSPLQALVIGLLGNSTAVVFGAAGAPIRIGFAGIAGIGNVPVAAALFNCVGFIVPMFMLWAATAGRPERKREFREALPFAVLAGLAFVLPSAASVIIGQEFPSILGSLAGLALMALAVRLKVAVPPVTRSLREGALARPAMPARAAILPYALLVVLLVAGKFALGSAAVSIPTGMAPHAFALFNPGFAFMVAGIVLVGIWKKARNNAGISLADALKGSWEPFLVIAAMSVIVQLLGVSQHNAAGLGSMISAMAHMLGNSLLPLWAPVAGAFGSFVTGSATIADMMFGNFLYAAALSQGIDSSIVLALGVVGASAGNMIALADMLAAQAVVGVRNGERGILKGTFVPCLAYVLAVAALGLVAARFL
jgi:lactate permease